MSHFSKYDRNGIFASVGIHALILLLAYFYVFENDPLPRSAFIEVTIGEYQTGRATEKAPQKSDEVKQRANPTDKVVEEEPDVPENVEKQEKADQEQVKQVDLADQQQTEAEEVVKTPDAEKVDPLKQAEKQQETVIPESAAKENAERKEGVEKAGDVTGIGGTVNTDQGLGSDDEKSAPFQLEWEGNIDRDPQVQPLPNYTVDVEAVITVRFQVKPDGSVGLMIPLKKMNPDLEKEVLRTLRSWRFSSLPKGVPQTVQWGTITFRFVLE